MLCVVLPSGARNARPYGTREARHLDVSPLLPHAWSPSIVLWQVRTAQQDVQHMCPHVGPGAPVVQLRG